MGDEVPQTPVPLPTYGQPAPPSQPAAPAPDVAMGEHALNQQPSTEAIAIAPSTESNTKDVAMTDAQAASPARGAPSPAPARTGTPLRTNGPENTSRAASQHPDPAFTMPDAAPPHGAPVRQYLNAKVVAHLLDGMKKLAQDKPEKPLQALAEFLLERSKEFEKSE
ncbi:hypothetical protein GGR57DRAFT_205940 [Xylariaceae sp. FL1272]|nr:hypothetical protein GGR57DRAFT_205940 [Xylariaceae sp. FL1272]